MVTVLVTVRNSNENKTGTNGPTAHVYNSRGILSETYVRNNILALLPLFQQQYYVISVVISNNRKVLKQYYKKDHCLATIYQNHGEKRHLHSVLPRLVFNHRKSGWASLSLSFGLDLAEKLV